MLAALLDEAEPVCLENGRLVLSYPTAATFSKRKVETPANRERVAEALRFVSGEELGLSFELSDSPTDGPAPGQPESVLSEEEVIERIKEVFGAEDVVEERRDVPGGAS